MAHHPEKFLDGHMLWHGRIYSPLPFIRSLWGTRINSGVWGTAAFPSVYRADVHPFAFLPHSIRWQIVSCVLALAGGLVAAIGGHQWASTLLLGSGGVGLAVTIAKNLAYALRSDVSSLPGRRIWYRLTVAYLHFIQPVARVRGRIRGILSPPATRLPPAEPQTSRGPRPSLREAARALLLLAGTVTEDRFWSETWTSADRMLSQLTDWLRRSRAVRSIEIDDGWSDDHDLSVYRRPLGLARHQGARRRSRRRPHASASGHASAADDVRRRRCPWLRVGSAGRRRRGIHAALAAGGRGHRAVDARPDRPRGLANGANDGHRAPRHRPGRSRAEHGVDPLRSGGRAAHLAVAAPDVQPAHGADFRRHDRRRRHGHVHAARGGDLGPAGHRQPRRRAAVRRFRRISIRPAGSSSRRTAISTSPTPTTTSSIASRGRPIADSSSRRSSATARTGSPATTVRRPGRSSTRRTASRSRQTAI